jgi:hypothetical protein
MIGALLAAGCARDDEDAARMRALEERLERLERLVTEQAASGPAAVPRPPGVVPGARLAPEDRARFEERAQAFRERMRERREEMRAARERPAAEATPPHAPRPDAGHVSPPGAPDATGAATQPDAPADDASDAIAPAPDAVP